MKTIDKNNPIIEKIIPKMAKFLPSRFPLFTFFSEMIPIIIPTTEIKGPA